MEIQSVFSDINKFKIEIRKNTRKIYKYFNYIKKTSKIMHVSKMKSQGN